MRIGFGLDVHKLVENRKFTQEEAEYAIEHAKIDWSD